MPSLCRWHQAVARKLFRQTREGSKLKLDLDGRIIPVQVKERSVNAGTDEILHISFQALKADQKVNSVIHILLKNTEKITAVLEKMRLEIPYAALPEDMIDTLVIDVDGMPVGTVLTVGDIPELRSNKVELQVDTEEIILRISDGRHMAQAIEQVAEV